MSSIAFYAINSIADTHAASDTRRIPINKVGIKDILHPVRILSRSGEEQHTVARDIALQLNTDARILAYTVEAENFESIHNHSAYAMVEKSKELPPDSKLEYRKKSVTL